MDETDIFLRGEEVTLAQDQTLRSGSHVDKKEKCFFSRAWWKSSRWRSKLRHLDSGTPFWASPVKNLGQRYSHKKATGAFTHRGSPAAWFIPMEGNTKRKITLKNKNIVLTQSWIILLYSSTSETFCVLLHDSNGRGKWSFGLIPDHRLSCSDLEKNSNHNTAPSTDWSENPSSNYKLKSSSVLEQLRLGKHS